VNKTLKGDEFNDDIKTLSHIFVIVLIVECEKLMTAFDRALPLNSFGFRATLNPNGGRGAKTY
jgi:hypothetical protein